MAKIDFSLVLACYNEGPTLAWSLEKIKEVLEDTRDTWEVICINDASHDDTLYDLQKFSKKNPKFKVFNHEKNVGRGGTVAEGIKLASGRIVGFIDIDLEISALYIPEFVREIKNGSDLAIATRVGIGNPSSLTKWITSRTYVTLVKIILGLKFNDTEAGYKFFNRKGILPILKKVEDKKWFFDTEIVTRSFLIGLKIKEIPVLFIKRPEKKSTVNIIPDSIEYLKKLFVFRSKIKIR